MYDHILKLLKVCGMGTLLLLTLACSQPAPTEPTPTEPIPSETGLPGPPDEVRVTVPEIGVFHIAWDSVRGAEYYRVGTSTVVQKSSNEPELLKSLFGTTPQFIRNNWTVAQRVIGTAYVDTAETFTGYWVEACNQHGCSTKTFAPKPPLISVGKCEVGAVLRPGESCLPPGPNGGKFYVKWAAGTGSCLESTTEKDPGNEHLTSCAGHLMRLMPISPRMEAQWADGHNWFISSISTDPRPPAPENARYAWDSSRILVSWDASEGAEYYKIYHSDSFRDNLEPSINDPFPDNRSSTSDFFRDNCESNPCTTLAGGVPQSTSYLHTDPDRDENYYWVIACNGGGCSNKPSEVARDLFQVVGSGQASMDLLDGYIADGADINAPNSRGRRLLEWAIYREHTAQVKILIEAGADVNAVGSRGDTLLSQAASSQLPDIARILIEEGADTNRGLPLISALRFGRPEMVAILVKGGADVNARDSQGSHGRSMLYHAIKLKDPEKVNILLDAGADVNHKNTDGPRLLHQAILSDNPEIVRTVIDAGVDVNAKTADGSSLLSIAIQYDNPEVVRIFIDAGADVSVISFARQYTPESIVQLLVDAGAQEYSVGSGDERLCRGYENLLSAIDAFGKIEELVECVIRELGADVNATDYSGSPVLFWAILDENLEIVRALVDAGADVNATDDEGKPVLYWAILNENPEIVRVLVDAGADVNATDYQGNPMLYEAIFSKNPEIVRVLVDAGADVNATDDRGTPVLLRAILTENPEIVRVVVDAGADVNATYDRGNPMLYWVILNGNPEFVRVVVDAGADVNATDYQGKPMLYEAIFSKNPEIVRVLVDAGADVNATDDRGNPMLYWAIIADEPEIVVRILTEAGAEK